MIFNLLSIYIIPKINKNLNLLYIPILKSKILIYHPAQAIALFSVSMSVNLLDKFNEVLSMEYTGFSSSCENLVFCAKNYLT